MQCQIFCTCKSFAGPDNITEILWVHKTSGSIVWLREAQKSEVQTVVIEIKKYNFLNTLLSLEPTCIARCVNRIFYRNYKF